MPPGSKLPQPYTGAWKNIWKTIRIIIWQIMIFGKSYCSLLTTLQWRHDERDGVSNHRRLDGFLSRLFRRRSKKTSKLRVTDLCEGNALVTGGFPSQRASNAEDVSIDDVIRTLRHEQIGGPFRRHFQLFFLGNFVFRFKFQRNLLPRSTICRHVSCDLGDGSCQIGDKP